MGKLVIFDDHAVVLDRVEGWLAEHPGVDLELDRGASRPIRPDGWQGLKVQIRDLTGPVLILLDLRLRFEAKTRERIRAEFGNFPPMLSPEVVDGYAVANLILRSEQLDGSLVVINSTIGVGDDLLANLDSVSISLGRRGKVRFVASGSALSTGEKEAGKILEFAAREFFGSWDDGQKGTVVATDPPLGYDAFKERLKEIYQDHRLFESPLVRRLSEPAGVSLEELRRFAVLYYPHVLRTRLYQAAVLAICPEENVQRALAAILYDEYGQSLPEGSHPKLYRDFLQGLQIPEKEWSSEPQIVELEMYIRTMEQASRREPWRFAIGVVGLGGELPIPKLYRGFLRGFGSLECLGAGALEIFRLHVEVDEDHSDLLVEAVSRSVRTRGEQIQLEEGLRYSLDLRTVVMEALGREVSRVSVETQAESTG